MSTTPQRLATALRGMLGAPPAPPVAATPPDTTPEPGWQLVEEFEQFTAPTPVAAHLAWIEVRRTWPHWPLPPAAAWRVMPPAERLAALALGNTQPPKPRRRYTLPPTAHPAWRALCTQHPAHNPACWRRIPGGYTAWRWAELAAYLGAEAAGLVVLGYIRTPAVHGCALLEDYQRWVEAVTFDAF